ncbi:chaperonin 10-like protein [Leptodontidium sp. MPI-SDFR-AT-0119]|nr:chaperonin 10-like protein [Leptodontidium sp. MPI-SDFR-AT-0119]
MTFDFTVYKGSPTGEIFEAQSHRPALTKDEIYIQITHSGVCGTDEHFKWVAQGLGHEGVGVVKAIGPDVKTFKVGDRAGWGYVNETCGVCEHCVAGDWIYCTGGLKQFGDGNTDQGSFGTGAVWREHSLFHIPDSMASDVAAPLMCAGITVFSPLTRYGLKSTDVVGVVGIGGLGHLALQFAKALGCEVVALSGSEEKKEEALRLGATHFVATKVVKDLKVPRKINHLIVTTSQMPDWQQYDAILAPMASIYPLTITDFETKLEIPFMNFLLTGRKFIGSTVPPKIVYIQMLEFAALHKVKPVIDPFPLTKQGVEDSLKKLDAGKMRYRGVLYAE